MESECSCGENVPMTLMIVYQQGRTGSKKGSGSPCYSVCEREEESTCHAIWSCIGDIGVWAEEASPLQKWSSNEMELYEVWENLILKVSREELELVATVMRKFWLRRNAFVF